MAHSGSQSHSEIPFFAEETSKKRARRSTLVSITRSVSFSHSASQAIQPIKPKSRSRIGKKTKEEAKEEKQWKSIEKKKRKQTQAQASNTPVWRHTHIDAEIEVTREVLVKEKASDIWMIENPRSRAATASTCAIDRLDIDDLETKQFESRFDDLLDTYEDEVRKFSASSDSVLLVDRRAPLLLTRELMIWDESHLSAVEFDGKIGNTSYSIVWKARYGSQDLCIREMLELEERARTQARIKVLHGLSHAHISKYYGLVHRESKPAMILEEFVDGISLSQIIQEMGTMNESMISYILYQLLSALSYLHNESRKIAHCNLTPENILLTKSGTVKLVDFFSAISPLMPELIPLNKISLNSKFIAPELTDSEDLASPLSDSWCVGCILYFLLSGHYVEDPDQVKGHLKKLGISDSCSEFLLSCLSTKDERPSIDELLLYSFLTSSSEFSQHDLEQYLQPVFQRSPKSRSNPIASRPATTVSLPDSSSAQVEPTPVSPKPQPEPIVVTTTQPEPAEPTVQNPVDENENNTVPTIPTIEVDPVKETTPTPSIQSPKPVVEATPSKAPESSEEEEEDEEDEEEEPAQKGVPKALLLSLQVKKTAHKDPESTDDESDDSYDESEDEDSGGGWETD